MRSTSDKTLVNMEVTMLKHTVRIGLQDVVVTTPIMVNTIAVKKGDELCCLDASAVAPAAVQKRDASPAAASASTKKAKK